MPENGEESGTAPERPPRAVLRVPRLRQDVQGEEDVPRPRIRSHRHRSGLSVRRLFKMLQGQGVLSPACQIARGRRRQTVQM